MTFVGQMAATGGGVAGGSADITGYGEMAATGGGVGAGTAALLASSTPDAILGAALFEWWDAGSGVTDSSGVTNWVGRKNGYAVVNGTAKPTYNATGWNSNFPCISFASASSQELKNSTTAALYQFVNGNDTLFSVIVCCKQSSTAIDAGLASWSNGSLNFRARTSNSSGGRADFQLGTQNSETTGTLGTTRHFLAYRRTSNTAHAINIDGATKETFSGLTDQGDPAATIFCIGSFNGLNYYNGDITQLILASGSITDQQVADLRTWAQNYCGGL